MRCFPLLLGALLLTGCGASVTEATDAGADGTADSTADGQSDVSPPDAQSDVAADTLCTCLDASLSWGADGGLVAYYDRSELTACNDYTRRRFEPGGTTVKLTCVTTLRNCSGDYTDADDTWSVHDVNSRLAHADVKAALAAAPVLYGKDPRAYDGSVFQLKVGGKTIEVGEACDTTPGCKPIPAGIAAMRDLLVDLDAKKQMVDCAMFK